MQPDESNTDLITWLMNNFNFRYLGLGVAGGTIGMLTRKRRNGWESFWMVFTGTICAGVFTDPVHAYLSLVKPDVASLTGLRDALAVVVAALGWSLIRMLVIDGPRLLKRWILSQADFAKSELQRKEKDNEQL